MYTKDFFFLNSLMNFVHFDAISKVGTRNRGFTSCYLIEHVNPKVRNPKYTNVNSNINVLKTSISLHVSHTM